MKKLVLFIVEGPTDEVALNSIFKSYFQQPSHRFQIVRGDVTSDNQSNPSNIKKRVHAIIKEFMDRYRYAKKDLLQVVQLIDTDGAFIPDERVIFSNDAHFNYLADCIKSDDCQEVISRNQRKRGNIYSLIHCGKIAGIPYKMLYFSRHLEHVLHDISNPDDALKMSLADRFDTEYQGRLDDFIKLIRSPEIAPAGDYAQTWTFIQEGCHSLHRHSNLHLVFDPKSGLIPAI